MPVTTLTATPNLLIVHPALPARNLQELVALIAAHPGKYNYAQTPMGSTSHFSAEMFRRRFRLELPAVPFNAATAAVAAVLSGRVPIGWIAVTTALSHIKDNKLRALAVTSAKRLDALPDVPTTTEAGASDLEAETLTGLLVPAQTPNAFVDRLSDEVAAVLTLPDVRRELIGRGMTPVPSRPSEFAVRINREIVRWRNIVRDSEIRAN
jgi:tripartite-type tricarboxylate transporter receptor subunit TctC